MNNEKQDNKEYIYIKSQDEIFESKQWKQNILNWAHEYFAGEFRVKGDSTLCKIYLKIAMELSIHGKIAVIKRGNNYFLAKINELEEDLADRPTKLKVSYLKNKSLQEYFELKRDKQGNILTPLQVTKESTLNEHDFVICKNNENSTPDLVGAEIYLNELNEIRKNINHYLFMTKPRLLADMPFRPKNADWQYVLDSWEIGYISVFTLNDGSQLKPTLLAPSQEGLERYSSLFNNKWSFFRQIYGIKHQRTKKQRQVVPEIEINEAQYSYLQNRRISSREEFLNEMENKWELKGELIYNKEFWWEK